MLQRLRTVVAAALAPAILPLAACGGTGTEGAPGAARASLVDGRSSPPGTREDAILFLRAVLDGAEFSCSATLVAKNLALTARHCVAHETQGPFTCSPRGELEDDGYGAGSLGLDLPADDLEFYTGDGEERRLVARGSQVVSTLTKTICIDDLAFVVLDRDSDLPVLPLRIGRAPRVGERVSMTGYGLDESMGFDTRLDELERHTRDDLAIDGVGPADAADATVTPPRSIVQTGAIGCVGDSGAPLYATATGAVLGVYSLLRGDSCTAADGLNLFTQVPLYTSLIADAFDAAGAEPTLEAEPPPGSGEGGASAGGAADEAGAGATVESAGGAGPSQAGEGGAAFVPVGSAGVAGGAGLAPTKRAGREGSSSGCALVPAKARTNALGALGVALFAVLVRRRVRGGRRVD